MEDSGGFVFLTGADKTAFYNGQHQQMPQKQQSPVTRRPSDFGPIRTNTISKCWAAVVMVFLIFQQQQQQQRPTRRVHLATTARVGGTHAHQGGKGKSFFIFTLVLAKYLEQKDPNLHVKAKAHHHGLRKKNRPKVKRLRKRHSIDVGSIERAVNEKSWKRANT